ncbi:exosortase/archaeosortase family protein [Cerasicoccus fimbriatus]|uniref:exosortase/archaeosortase family protein n=1 Tax=Cerasicoccus fimbriatus TaxID=3014554 RepID=UPI0022B4A285|nr:exosortase/archaeosortase family protein [Cerasicoccus sp. TK19100]
MNHTTLKIWLLPLALQFAFYYQISGFWDPDSHYFYGWGIPFLSLFLFWTRSEDEPERDAPWMLLLVPALVFFLMFAGMRVLWETMSSWHMLSWAQGACLAAFCITWGTAWGGFRWSWHYAFPLLFFLASIPWPGRLELGVSDWLTGHIANIVTFSLQMLGIPAMLQGIQISIGDAKVEVAEACSGIRSLQFLLVATLFLGEYGKFSMPRRITLLACGIVASFIQNAIRALALGWITGIEGQEAYDRWHDNAGAITFVVGLSMVLIAFLIIEPKDNNKATPKKTESAYPIPGICLALTALVLIAYGGVELFRYKWYDMPTMHEAKAWQLNEEALNKLPWHRSIKVDEVVNNVLETEDIQAGQFLYNDSLVNYNFVSWPEGYSVMRVNAHNPEYCMGSVQGLEQTKPLEAQMMTGNWDGIECEVFEFRHTISAEKITIFRSLMLPVSTQNYYQFYQQASGSWWDKWKMAYHNFWDRVDENSMLTRQLLLVGVTSPTPGQEDAALYHFLNEAIIEKPL